MNWPQLSRRVNGCGRALFVAGIVALAAACGAGDPAPLRVLLDEFERMHPGMVAHCEMLPAASDEQHQFYAIIIVSPEAAERAFA